MTDRYMKKGVFITGLLMMLILITLSFLYDAVIVKFIVGLRGYSLDYIFLSVGLCLLATWIGMLLARQI